MNATLTPQESRQRYPVVLERAGKNLSAYAPDLPGAIATGKERDEVEQNMRAALLLHLLELRASGEKLPTPTPEAELDLADLDLAETDEVVWLTPDTPDPVSRAISRTIERSELSQAEVARRMGTSRSTLSRLTSPVYHGHSVQTLRRLGDALGMEVVVSFEERR